MSKRTRPCKGFYEEINSLPRAQKIPKKVPVLGEFLVEHIVAKRKNGSKNEFLILWKGFSPEDYTWEPEINVPPELRQAFEFPVPDDHLLKTTKEQLALVFERSLKSPLMTIQTLEVPHSVIRTIFPVLPSTLGREFTKLYEQDFNAAGLSSYMERIISLTRKRRKVLFPVLVKLTLGKAPFFFDQDGKKTKTRYVERFSLKFCKETRS